MKRILSLLLVMVLLCSLASVSMAQTIYVPGTYTASSKGFGGAVTVTIAVDDAQITDVVIEGADETPNIGGAALATLAAQIKDGAQVDGVSGATVTGTAVKEALSFALAAAQGNSSMSISFTPGTYTASAQGMWSGVTVAVTVDGERITSVDVTDCQDTPIIAEAAIAQVTARIIDNQSLAIDAASGATVTSNAILCAAKSALSQASDGNIAALVAPLPDKEMTSLPDESYDVVVVGAGGAGIAAALEVASSSEYTVLLLEKESWIGGSTALSGGGITVVNTPKNLGEGIDMVFSNDGEPLDCTPDDIVTYYKNKTETLSKRPQDMWINEELVRRIFEHSIR